MRTGSRRNSPFRLIYEEKWASRKSCGFVVLEASVIFADHQVPVKRPLVCLNTLFSPPVYTLPPLVAATQHCAGRCVGQCRHLIGSDETAAPQPQEVYCNPCSTQSGLWGLLAGTRLTCLCHLTSTFIKKNKNRSSVCTENTSSSCATALFLILRFTLITENELRAFVVFFWTFSFALFVSSVVVSPKKQCNWAEA